MAKMTLAGAAFDGNDKALARLLSESKDSINLQDGMGFTPLHWTADLGHGSCTRLLLDAGADPNLQDMEGLTPLHYASIKGSLECAKLLIPLSDIDTLDDSGEAALFKALESVRMSSAGFDIERGEPAGRIADLIRQEPGRRAAFAQAQILSSASGPGSSAPPRARI